MAARGEEFKHGEGGYTGRQAPGCNTCNTIDMGRPLQATRVSAWVRCFLQLNRRWLIQLTKEARTALRTLLPVRCLVGGVHARCVGGAQSVEKKVRHSDMHFREHTSTD